MSFGRLQIWIRALRVEQWTKNALVPAAWFFAAVDVSRRADACGWGSFLRALATAVSFSLVASAFYLLNDISDSDADRLHPVKCRRPIAAGLLSRRSAACAAFLLLLLGFAYPALAVSLFPGQALAFGTILAYALLQGLYTCFLKRVAYLDAVALAFGFVLRAVAGAAVVTTDITAWLLVTTFLLALFLVLCKRKHELETARDSRSVLSRYNPSLLRALALAAGAATALVYAAYTFCSGMGRTYPALWVSSLFVLAGIARYAVLAGRGQETGRPERVLLTDLPLGLVLLGYSLSVGLAVACCR